MFSKTFIIPVIALFFTILFHVNCHTSNTALERCSPFSGITEIDTLGNNNGRVDANDWQDAGILQSLHAYPNPAKTRVVIQFSLSQSAFVKATVNDKPDQVVKTLIEQNMNAGLYRVVWDLTDESGKKLPPCIYRVYFTVTLTSGQRYQTFGDIEIRR